MSNLTLRNSLIAGVQAALPAFDPITDIAYENSDFKPDDLERFIAVYYMPATVEPLGKTKPSRDDMRGIFQVSIFIKLNSVNFDNDQLTIADDLRSYFYIGRDVGEAFIESAELGEGGIDDGWFKRDMSINYISYQTR